MITVMQARKSIQPYITVFKDALELNDILINITVVGSRVRKIYSELCSKHLTTDSKAGYSCHLDGKSEVYLFCSGIEDEKDAILTLAHELLHTKFYHGGYGKKFKSNQAEENVISLVENLLKPLI